MRHGFKQACIDIAEKYGWELIRDSGGHCWWGFNDRTAGVKRIATSATPANEHLELQSLESKLRAAMRERGMDPTEHLERLAQVKPEHAARQNQRVRQVGAALNDTIRILERVADPGWVSGADLLELTGEHSNPSAMGQRLRALAEKGIAIAAKSEAARRATQVGGKTPTIYRLKTRHDGTVKYEKPRLAPKVVEPLASDVRADEPAAVPVSVSAVATPVLHADFNEQVQHIAEEIARIVAYRVSDLEDQVTALTKERDAAIARLEAIEDILTRATDVKVAE